MTKTQQELETITSRLSGIAEILEEIWSACLTPNTEKIVSKAFRFELLGLSDRIQEMKAEFISSTYCAVVIPNGGDNAKIN